MHLVLLCLILLSAYGLIVGEIGYSIIKKNLSEQIDLMENYNRKTASTYWWGWFFFVLFCAAFWGQLILLFEFYKYDPFKLPTLILGAAILADYMPKITKYSKIKEPQEQLRANLKDLQPRTKSGTILDLLQLIYYSYILWNIISL